MKTVALHERIPPVRGLVTLHNRKGKPFGFTQLARWLRLNRTVYKTEKADLLVHGAVPRFFEDLVRFCADVYDPRISVPLHLAVSLRTDATAPPPDLARLRGFGLAGVFLAQNGAAAAHAAAWLDAARDADLPSRIQVQPPFPEDFDAEAYAAAMAAKGVTAANVILADAFLPKTKGAGGAEGSRRAAERMNRLVRAFADAGVEANLYGAPLCWVDADNLGRAGNSALYFLDHQQYTKPSYDLAELLFGRTPPAAAAIVTAMLGRYTHLRNPADEWVLEHLVTKRQFLRRVVMFGRKLIRGRERGVIGGPKAKDPAAEPSYEEAVTQALAAKAKALGPICGACRFRRVCDRDTKAFRRALPGLSITAQEGEPVASALALTADQPKHYDAIDSARLGVREDWLALAREANQLITDTPPTHEFGRDRVLAEQGFHVRMPGAIRWHSMTAGETRSTLFHWGHAPFTVSAMFGGGIADYVGFAVGRAIRIVCRMDAFSHRIVLHVAEDGRYVLLRDGAPMTPVEFEGSFYAPVRLPTVCQLRFSLWNIDESVCTQNLQVWEGVSADEPPARKPQVSFIIVSTRFTRRLQAVLQSIAHQTGVEHGDMEVVVGYVPGVDATDDVINSMQFTYPDLRIVRSGFPEQRAKAKGLIINESVARSSGDWIVILDSDILLHPGFVAGLLELPPEAKFVAPKGRKMLTRETTARILLGEATPWRDWDELLPGPGESRFQEAREGGTLPVGFCQCFRRYCFDTVQYHEYEHFEGADWEFSIEMNQHFGPVVWIERPVLHLDHGGSQWFGATGHL